MFLHIYFYGNFTLLIFTVSHICQNTVWIENICILPLIYEHYNETNIMSLTNHQKYCFLFDSLLITCNIIGLVK